MGCREIDSPYKKPGGACETPGFLLLFNMQKSKAVFLSVLLFIFSPFYVKIYSVKPLLHKTAQNILIAFAIISPVKVLNMILGGGIIRSGGKTKYVMWIDMAGTWLFEVPLGLFAAFVWNLPIEYVYFILSMEECVRPGISFVLFRRKTWMESLR